MLALLALVSTLTEEDRLALAWAAPEECGTAAQVRTTIDELLEGGTPRPESVAATVTISAVEQGYALELEIREGGHLQRRELASPSCDELRDTAALIVAMTLDPRLGSAPEVPSSFVPEPQTMEPPTSTRTQVLPVAPSDRGVPPIPRPSRPRLRPPAAWLSASAGVGLGAVPDLAPVVALAVTLGDRLWRVELETAAWLPQVAISPENAALRAQIWMWSFGARACAEPAWRRLSFPICGGFDAGPMIGTGQGDLRSETGVSAWVAATASAGAIVWPAPRWGLWLRVLGHLALRRPTFDTEPSGEVLYTAEAGGARVLAGVSVRLH